MRVGAASWIVALLLSACADPCAGLEGDPAVTIAGANDAAEFEDYPDGAERPLVSGLQGGMHVWLQLRLDNVCVTSARVDGRVVHDETGVLIGLQRGPLRWIDGPTAGSFVLGAPEPLVLCPSGVPVVGERLRIEASVEDGDGRRADSQKVFVASCPSGACDGCNGT